MTPSPHPMSPFRRAAHRTHCPSTTAAPACFVLRPHAGEDHRHTLVRLPLLPCSAKAHRPTGHIPPTTKRTANFREPCYAARRIITVAAASPNPEIKKGWLRSGPKVRRFNTWVQACEICSERLLQTERADVLETLRWAPAVRSEANHSSLSVGDWAPDFSARTVSAVSLKESLFLPYFFFSVTLFFFVSK